MQNGKRHPGVRPGVFRTTRKRTFASFQAEEVAEDGDASVGSLGQIAWFVQDSFELGLTKQLKKLWQLSKVTEMVDEMVPLLDSYIASNCHLMTLTVSNFNSSGFSCTLGTPSIFDSPSLTFLFDWNRNPSSFFTFSSANEHRLDTGTLLLRTDSHHPAGLSACHPRTTGAHILVCPSLRHYTFSCPSVPTMVPDESTSIHQGSHLEQPATLTGT